MLNLIHVRAFVAVVESGSFRGAAQRLGVAQATVSQQVGKLERALAAQLIARGRPVCVPTPNGRTFLSYAHSLLAVAERAAGALANRNVVLGASSNIGIYILPQYLRALGPAENAKFDVRIASNPVLAERLERREVDFGLMEWWDGRPGYSARIWRREPLVVIVGRDHAWASRGSVDKAELLDVPMLGGEPGSGTGRLLRDAWGASAANLRPGPQLGSTEAVKQAVKAGLGVSIVLAGTVRDEVAAGELVARPIADAALYKELHLVVPAHMPLEGSGRTLAATLCAAAPGAGAP